jgi:hypothetical protein
MVHEGRDARLLAYTVASADMRYIEVNEREVYLRNDPALGPVVRGEVPGCDSSCDAGLSQVLLEYVISCEGCKGEPIEADAADRFGRQLGTRLVNNLYPAASETPVMDRLAGAFDCILNSMPVSFRAEHAKNRLDYTLTHDPLQMTAQETGLTRGVDMARRAFVALCTSVIQALAPDWTLARPTDGGPLLRVGLNKSEE